MPELGAMVEQGNPVAREALVGLVAVQPYMVVVVSKTMLAVEVKEQRAAMVV